MTENGPKGTGIDTVEQLAPEQKIQEFLGSLVLFHQSGEFDTDVIKKQLELHNITVDNLDFLLEMYVSSKTSSITLPEGGGIDFEDYALNVVDIEHLKIQLKKNDKPDERIAVYVGDETNRRHVTGEEKQEKILDVIFYIVDVQDHVNKGGSEHGVFGGADSYSEEKQKEKLAERARKNEMIGLIQRRAWTEAVKILAEHDMKKEYFDDIKNQFKNLFENSVDIQDEEHLAEQLFKALDAIVDSQGSIFDLDRQGHRCIFWNGKNRYVHETVCNDPHNPETSKMKKIPLQNFAAHVFADLLYKVADYEIGPEVFTTALNTLLADRLRLEGGNKALGVTLKKPAMVSALTESPRAKEFGERLKEFANKELKIGKYVVTVRSALMAAGVSLAVIGGGHAYFNAEEDTTAEQEVNKSEPIQLVK